ncbi:mariner transposase [Trichonephila clavipes]|nr:mariner transposase [Trichonephila clavipes]
MEVNKEKIQYILQFFFDKDENASQSAEIVNGVYGADTRFLPYGQTLISDLYCQQLDRLKLEINQKHPELANRRGVVFHQDNARTHTSLVTCQKLWELDWEVLMHHHISGPGTKLLPPFSRITKLPE